MFHIIYGVKHFGQPKEYKISEGVDIDLEFNGQPRDYQIPVINNFLEHCKKINLWWWIIGVTYRMG